MRHLILLAFLFTACSESESQSQSENLIFERSELVTESLKSVSLELGPRTYSGIWMGFYSNSGDLDDLDEESSDVVRRFSPIVFSGEEPHFRPSVGARQKSIEGTSKIRLSFFCDPYQEEPRIQLDPETIYFYDTKLRGVVKIGSFAGSSTKEEIEKTALAAIQAHVGHSVTD